MTEDFCFGFRYLVIGIYLGFGLPACSRFGKGRCLGFGILTGLEN